MVWPDIIAGWIQLILNAGAILTGGFVWKQYFENLKATVSSKQAEVDLHRGTADYWRDRAGELEKQTPAAVERVLAERITIREKEIERLAADRDQDSEEREQLQRELVLLNRTMEQTKGFRDVLAMETPSPGDPDYDEWVEHLREYPPEPVESEVLYLGSVGVDSGQLMITDPCYVDGHWQEEDFEDSRAYKDAQTGASFRIGMDFERFDQVLPPYQKPPKELIAEGRWVELPPAPPPEVFHYSYNGACQATLSDGYGELVYRQGHSGAAVVFGSGWGDGIYPVFGERQRGRIVRVYVNMGAEPAPLLEDGSSGSGRGA